jgi:hypothetical protein
MKKKNFLPDLSGIPTIYLSAAGGFLLMIPAIIYGPPDLHNPFYIASCGLAAQVFFRGLTGDFKGKKNAERKKALLLGPLNILTGLLMLFALPSNPVVAVLAGLMTATFFDFGLRSTLFAISHLMELRKDSKEFRKEMQETAETARMEQALADDLALFLSDVEPMDNTENRED